MLPSLRDNDRHLLTMLALMLCCGSVALMPLGAQSSVESFGRLNGSDVADATPVSLRPLHFPIIVAARDPFSPDRSVIETSGVGISTENSGNLGIILPPNAGASGVPISGPVAPDSVPIVRAVVLGPQSRALVESSGTVQVLGVGDSLSGEAITAIDARGIILADGSRLPLRSERQ